MKQQPIIPSKPDLISSNHQITSKGQIGGSARRNHVKAPLVLSNGNTN
jgi:hypothetical protein